jgi:hypothetical protein
MRPRRDWKVLDDYVDEGNHVVVVAFRRSFVVVFHSVGHWVRVESLSGPQVLPNPCFGTRRTLRSSIPAPAGRLVSGLDFLVRRQHLHLQKRSHRGWP